MWVGGSSLTAATTRFCDDPGLPLINHKVHREEVQLGSFVDEARPMRSAATGRNPSPLG
jgi:hypothetical protein